jgi:hypothetical protein
MNHSPRLHEGGDRKIPSQQSTKYKAIVTMDDNGEFTNYNEATLDPGWSFLVGAVAAGVLLFSILPCLVSLGSRYERRKSEAKTQGDGETTDDDDGSSKGSSGGRKKVLLVDMSKFQPLDNPPTNSWRDERMKEMPADSEKVQRPLGDGRSHQGRVKSASPDQPPSASDTIIGWFCNFAELVSMNVYAFRRHS